MNICMIKKSLGNFKHVFSYHSTPEIDVGKLVGVWPGQLDLEKSLANFIFGQNNIDYYLACSFNYLNTVKKYIMPNIKKYKVIYYGVDFNKFSYKKIVKRQKLKLKDKDIILLCPVRMIERKGILDMLNTVKILKDNPKIGNNIKLIIPTSKLSERNEFYMEVKTRIKDLKLNNNIKIISDKFLINDMPTLYALSDVMILPSYAEGLGIVLLESMSMKKPVIATDIPGVNEVVKHEKTGLLVPIKSPKSIALAVERIIFDEKLRNNIVEGGYKFVSKNFNLEIQVKEIEKLFKSIL
ncbi:glycosyltransferase family 4 protein [Candidatus Parcubacteria bacterium]|nr:glycosyltransferase family 4 protein [Candidatus Parcubacteria bacterium]